MRVPVLALPFTIYGVLGKLFYPLCLSFLLCNIGIRIPHRVVQNGKGNAGKATSIAFGTLINDPTCYHYNECNRQW